MLWSRGSPVQKTLKWYISLKATKPVSQHKPAKAVLRKNKDTKVLLGNSNLKCYLSPQLGSFRNRESRVVDGKQKKKIIYTKDQNLSSRKRKEIQWDWGCLIILPYCFIKYSLKWVGWDLELRDLIIAYNLLEEHYDPLIEKRFYFKKKSIHSKALITLPIGSLGSSKKGHPLERNLRSPSQ